MKKTLVPKDSRSNFFGFVEFLEDGPVPAEGLPVFIHFHGTGEKGLGTIEDLARITNTNMAKACLSANPFGVNCIVYAPQDPYFSVSTKLGIELVLKNIKMRYSGTYKVKEANGVETTLPKADLNRIYPIGLSAGGGSVHLAIANFPDEFAAAVSVCASSSWPKEAAKLVNFPIHMFHAEDDPICKASISKDMYNALIAAGSKVAKLTIYPTGGHGIWDKAYATEGLWSWVLSQRKNKVVANIPPYVTITTVLPDKIVVGQDVTIEGVAGDTDGAIKSVNCYSITRPIEPVKTVQLINGFFKFTLSGLPVGRNEFKIEAVDNNDAKVSVNIVANIYPTPNPVLIPALGNYQVINEVGTNKIAEAFGKTVNIFDKGDKIRIPVNATAGNYRIKVAVRTGYRGKVEADDRPMAQVNGYALYVNSFIPTPHKADSSAIVLRNIYGGMFFGELEIQSKLDNGVNYIDIEALGYWGIVDYVQVLEVWIS